MYVDKLIGAQTINTMTPDTINAFRDHGHPGNRLEEGIEEAQLLLDNLAELGIDLDLGSESRHCYSWPQNFSQNAAIILFLAIGK